MMLLIFIIIFLHLKNMSNATSSVLLKYQEQEVIKHAVPQQDDKNADTMSSAPLSFSPQNRSIVFIHTGKTGGTTLDLAFRANCLWYGNAL